MPFGEALFYITMAYAQLERGILSERTKAGLERARRQGKHIGRPPVTARVGFQDKWARVRAELISGAISRGQAARSLKVGYATLLRLLKADQGG